MGALFAFLPVFPNRQIRVEDREMPIPPEDSPQGAPRTNQGAPRTNWSGNYVYTAPRVYRPADVAGVQAIVAAEPRVRALGTRHCFNGIADSAGAQIDTGHLRDITIDREGATARVGAGVRYGDLALELDAAGFALHNLASLPHISVGGAVATGTHGSGLALGNLATAVVAFETVGPDGRLHAYSRAHDPRRFQALVVGLGAVGIMTHVTLRLQPSFHMTQIVYEGLPFAELGGQLNAIMGAAYSVSLFTDWQNSRVTQAWVKHRVAAGERVEPSPTFFGGTLATEQLHPLTGQPAKACTDQGTSPGPWYARLPHFKLDFQPSRGDELQTEYFVPIERGYEAICAVERIQHRFASLLYVTELRSVAADDLWLSGQYERDTLAIHFTWKLEPEKVLAVLPEIEAALMPFAPRPHWGKVFTMRAEDIRVAHPRWTDFLALAGELDPQGKFRNSCFDAWAG